MQTKRNCLKYTNLLNVNINLSKKEKQNKNKMVEKLNYEV